MSFTTTTARLSIIALGLGLGACATEVDGEEEDITTQGGVEQRTGMNRFADFSPIPNTEAEVERGQKNHSVEVDTDELIAGHVVVFEYIVYNAPENCTNPTPWGRCSVPDSMNPATESSAIWVKGKVIGSSGEWDTGERTIGMGVSGAPGEVAWGPGITDVRGSEAHFLMFDKGKPISGRLTEQLNTFQGGCDVRACQPYQFGIVPAL